MSYININEVDKTVQDLAPAQSDNIVYVPLNSTDGPSGVYNVLQDYSDFVSIYGSDPNPNSTMMTSWDFAANLLLRKMPVMVRRITREIDEDGNDTNKLLPGASLSTGLLKVNDVIGASQSTAEAVLKLVRIVNTELSEGQEYYEPVIPVRTKAGDVNKIEIYSSASIATPSNNSRGQGLAFKLNDKAYDVEMPTEDVTFSQGGGFSITNISEEPIYLKQVIMGGLKHQSSTSKLLDASISNQNLTKLVDESLILKYKQTTKPGEFTGEYQEVYEWESTNLEQILRNSYISIVDDAGTLIPKSKINVSNYYGDITPVEEGKTAADQCMPVIELPAGYTLRYSLDFGDSYMCVECINKKDTDINLELDTFVSVRNSNTLSNTIFVNSARSDAVSIQSPNTANPKYLCEYVQDDGTVTEPEMSVYEAKGSDIAVGVTYLPVNIESENNNSIHNAPEYDSEGNINLFKMYYRNVGSNGERFSAALKTVEGDGIYLIIYAGEQRVETIQLVNLRYRTPVGRYAYYDIYADRDIIWKLFLANFGLSYPAIKTETPKTLTTTYLDIELNENIDTEFLSYLDSIYMCRGDIRWKLTGGSCPDDDCVLHEVYKTYLPLRDKYLYDVKFISNGGFVDPEITPASVVQIPQIDENTRWIEDAQIALAESRGDCLALVDVPMDIDKEDALGYFQHISTSYAACYCPWVQLNLLTKTTKWCPASFAALWTIAKSVNNGNKIYAPPAGVNRANLPECQDLVYQIPSSYIDTWQDNYTQFINPIVYINGYGVNIFGQKTLYNKVDGSNKQESALQYLNVRLVANEVKKKIFKSCIELTFEYNNLHTWLAFKSKMTELLDTLLYDNSISYYDVRMDESTMTTADITSNHIVGIVSIAVSSTAEKFDITFELLPNQVNFIDIDYASNSSDDAYGTQL